MTENQVKKTELTSLPKIIAQCGYNRNLALDIQGGPKEIGGAGFYSFKNMIGAARIQYFLKKKWRTPTEDIGKTLRIAMSWTQYNTGITYPKLSKTSQDLSCLKGRTILATRKYLKEYHGMIHLDITWGQHPK